MGLWSATKSLFKGEGKQAMDYLFVDEDTIAKDTEVTEKLDALNRRELEERSISEQEYRERLSRLSNTAFPDFREGTSEEGRIFDQPELSPAAGFGEGLQEGADNIRKTVGKTINGAVGLTWKLIPWQVWAAVLVYVAFITSPYWGAALGLKFLKRGK